MNEKYLKILNSNLLKSEKTFCSLFPDIYKDIINSTSFLDIEDQNWKIRKYCYRNNITEYPKCKICGKKCKIDRKCCSQECTKIYCKSEECISKKIEKTKKIYGDDCYKRKMSNFDILKKNDEELYNDIFSKTNWMDENTSYSERMYCYKNNITEYPKCKICGKSVNFIQGHGYTKTCSKTCSKMLESNTKLNFSEEKKRDIRERQIQTKLNFSEEKKRDIREKTENTCIKKYGFKSPAQNDVIRKKVSESNKITQNLPETKEKIIKSNIEKYGVSNVSNLQRIRDKISESNKITQNLPETKEKIRQTNIRKYNHEHFAQSEDYLKKTRQSNIEKYGIDNYNKKHYSQETRNALFNRDNLEKYIRNNNIKSIPELSIKLNIQDCTALSYVKKYNIEGLINRNVSHYEDEITDWLKSFNIEVINNKRILDKKEIDIFLPKYNVGIEFNGTYWHSDIYRNKDYHLQKTLEAKKNGIFLYHIFEFEWKCNEEKIKNQLMNLLGLNNSKIYARKCVIKEITDNKIKSDFLNLNHLQGNDNSNIKLGLYYDDVLVEIMTFCKPRFNKKYQYELSRLCSLKGYNIVGGASKLFHYFIEKYHPISIISYSNISKNKGTIYNKLGFKLKNISSPNYFWIKGDTVLTRYQTQKHKLLSLNFKGKNEDDIMRKNGFIKIYDCGNMVFEYIS